MPIDPLAALNAMLRAEAARSADSDERRHSTQTDAEVRRGPARSEPGADGGRPAFDDGAV
ncbi:hypothetical protein OG883_10775 [Streptomyces sp. NBC_01142]|uniref:hypothetical protein n=1 Tax=Streptomyces sp. NBC_01142 TaxID=2975865 RepID=UPI002259CDD9|nr:hypothetical protein [Streptomyces sp. NBC_01142]MCX4820384.1 hypothetical protein [Streptomyces sp. NBC_01142]